ncbi:hypothetical protein ACLQ28_29275 [Micromonospora sp. DT201]|uniref:hypothetical protein n=1 Tax=Micromonospora sp. DT201 TaxID=3393442 RepID=UPI003CEDEB87
MLPVALTCPLWWVARWATRVLTSLAVVAALALGAGTASAAAPTLSAVPTLSAAPSLSAEPSAFAPGLLAAFSRPTSGEGVVHPAQAVRAGAGEESFPAGSVDSHPAPPGGQGTIAAGVLPVHAAGSDRLPLVDGPHRWAPRGPPRR